MRKPAMLLPMALVAAVLPAIRATAADAMRHLVDVTYAQAGTQPMRLDLHLPADRAAPLVVYLHGGAWRDGNKTQYPEFLVARGFAVASVEFRASTVARFPANVHDIKAAVRFLRAKAREYGYSAERIAISGASSGGHLAALVGTTNGVVELEGDEGGFVKESSAVQAIVSWYGASNLNTILAQSTPFGLSVREPALRLLLGGLPEEVPALARLASPVEHLDARDPPALLMHGDQDRQMPVNQLLELEGAYRRAGLSVETFIVHGAGHGGDAFSSGEAAERAVVFLQRTIGKPR
jgi:acetyl esterase/lipase